MPTYKLMWRLIRYRPWFYCGNGLIWILIQTMPIVPGLLMQQFFNRLTNNQQAGLDVWSLIALIAAADIANVLLNYAGQITDVTYRFSISNLMRRNLLSRILERPGARALPASPGEAISRFRDDVEQAELGVSLTLDIIGTTLFAIAALVILLGINTHITLFVFSPLVGVIIIARFASEHLDRYRAANREATGHVTKMLGEMFGIAQTIQVAGAEDYVIREFRRLNAVRRSAAIKDIVLSQGLNSIYTNIASLGTGLVLILAAEALVDARFTIGDLALFMYYLAFVTGFTQFFGSFLAQYQQIGVSFKRLIELLQGASPEKLTQHYPLYLRGSLPALPVPVKTPADQFNHLEVRGLGYHHPQSMHGVSQISFGLPRGSFTVITGRMGSGKTTLVRTLLGLLPKDSGTVLWNGREVEDSGAHFVPPRCAYTPQVPQLFSTTLRENILLGLPEDTFDLSGALYQAVLERDVVEMSSGLNTLVGPRGVRLSGGQGQRTAAARMFIRKPELLVFDDLSSALDVETEQILWGAATHKVRGGQDGAIRPEHAEGQAVTCLVVSHRKAALQQADQIIVLLDGHIEAIGRLPDLLENCDEMRRIWLSEPEKDSSQT